MNVSIAIQQNEIKFLCCFVFEVEILRKGVCVAAFSLDCASGIVPASIAHVR